MTYLVISDPGSYLRKAKERFKVTFGYSTKPASYIPANRVEGVLVETKMSISSGAFELLRKYGIPVVWKERFDDDGLILLPFTSNGSVEIRREQYSSLEDYRGVIIATCFAYAACVNKLAVLRRITRYHQSVPDNLTHYITQIEEIIHEFSEDDQSSLKLDFDYRQKLMNYEARNAKIYYSALQEVLQTYGWDFNGRSRRPAQDEFNALLNYCYAVLKGQLQERISITGLDIYAGYLHVDRSGRESLLLDLIEEFRQIVDEVLLKLVMSYSVEVNMFEHDDEGIFLSKEVKGVVVNALLERLNQRIRSRKLQSWIIYQARQLSKYVRGQISEYKPFQIKVKDPW